MKWAFQEALTSLTFAGRHFLKCIVPTFEEPKVMIFPLCGKGKIFAGTQDGKSPQPSSLYWSFLSINTSPPKNICRNPTWQEPSLDFPLSLPHGLTLNINMYHHHCIIVNSSNIIIISLCKFSNTFSIYRLQAVNSCQYKWSGSTQIC